MFGENFNLYSLSAKQQNITILSFSLPVLQVNFLVLPLNYSMCNLFCRFHVDKMSSAHVYLRLRKVRSGVHCENVDVLNAYK